MRFNSGTLLASALFQTAGFFTLSGCLDIPRPPADIDYTEEVIMPNEWRFVFSDKSSTGIEGPWFWYRNIGCEIERVEVTTETDTVLSWYNSTTRETTQTKQGDIESPIVKEICFSGNLQPLSDASDGYAGIGFNLCSSIPTLDASTAVSDDSTATLNRATDYPHTLGTCNIGGQETILRKFLGISFNVTIPQTLKDSKLIVQFRERGYKINDKQPYCIVFDNYDEHSDGGQACYSEKAETENGLEYRVMAWHGGASNSNRDSKIGERNLAALQAIQFQLSSENEKGQSFQFCLSDIAAIWADDLRDNVENIPPYIPKYLPDVQQDEKKCLAEVAGAYNDTDTPLWVDAKAPSGTSCDTQDYPGGQEFQIMKKEVTAAQYNDCVNSGVCTQPREWESCSIYKFKMLTPEGSTEKTELTTTDAIRSANCVNWYDARNFCHWIGGRLPTLEQWEYAARSGSSEDSTDYPWVDEQDGVNCDLAIITNDSGPGCGNENLPVAGCSKTSGNTATGACDMIGNLWEWVEAPSDDATDGGETEINTEYQYIKGGGFNNSYVKKDTFGFPSISSSTRVEHGVEPHDPIDVGFRCIRFVDAKDPCK